MNNLNNLSANKKSVNVSYWQKELAGITPVASLTGKCLKKSDEVDRDKINRKQYKSCSFSISSALAQQLNRVASEAKTSLSMVLLSAFQVLLYRYSDRDEIVVGYQHEGDNYRGSNNILPIKATVESEQKYPLFLADIATKVNLACKHADLDINAVVRSFDLQQNSLDAISQFVFQFKSFLSANVVENAEKIFDSELLFEITERPECLALKIKFGRQFEKSTIERFGNNYLVLLGSIAHDSNRQIALLPILNEAEKQILADANHTETEPASSCIHQLFEARVRQNSEATAIICQGQQLTYGELNQQANQLAHYLQAEGVKPGSLVGLCIERSLSMVVGVLAILKAGAAYVPLDISNPPARIAFILEDAGVEVLLTHTDLLNRLPTQVKQTVCIDRDRDAIARQSDLNLNEAVELGDLAHIVYTSGSTGKPKGVMLTHGNLSHYAQSLQQAFEIEPSDIYLHRGSIALIVSARQLLMPLAQGATVLILTTAEVKDPIESFRLIRHYGVTIVDRVPSFWRNFKGILERQDPDFRSDLLDNNVRLVAAGGEQVTPEIYQCWRETFKPHVKLANIYGQTEGTGVVTVYQIPQNRDRGFKFLPVGSPIPNMRVYLLDKRLQQVPIGVTAEIHISGAGVAKGYLNRPELTAEKFIDNPYLMRERLYKTGDLGRYLADGTVQFLGRADRQVNIQGLRIELGEIESVLSQSELVTEAAVVVRSNNLGEALAAYIVLNTDRQPTTELRSYLAEKLPAYMIPNTFTYVDAFPLTTSGKVDRRALSTIDVSEPATIVAPSDRLEAEILAMIREILGVEAIGVRDNFIELGGNSLLAARLVTEIEQKYAHKLAVSRVFQAPTAQGLANLIRDRQTESNPKSFVPIKQGDPKSILFCLHNLGYGLEFYLPLARHMPQNLSLYGLSSAFDNEPNKPHFRDIRHSAAYYARDIVKVQPQGPYHLTAVSFGGIIAYETAQILVSQGHEVKFLGLLDSYCPKEDAAYQPPAVKDRIIGHLQRIRSRGISHIYNRINWRIGAIADKIRYFLYKIDWIRDNFADTMGRNFAQTQYIQERKEQQRVNQGYEIDSYPGKVWLFRATDDVNPKLGWQDLAEGGLSIDDIPGEHIEMLTEPNVKVLAEKITLAMESN